MHVVVVKRAKDDRATPSDDSPSIGTLDDRGVFVDAEHPMMLGPDVGGALPPLDRDSIEMRSDEDAGEQAERISCGHATWDTGLVEAVRKVKGAAPEHHRAGAR